MSDEQFAKCWMNPGITDFNTLRRLMFRYNLQTCGGLNLWVCAGTSCMERARILWNEAIGYAERMSR